MIIIPRKLWAPETGFGGGATEEATRTAENVEYGALSSEISWEVTDSNTLCSLSDPTDGSGDITLTYTLKNDSSTTSSIRVEYSLDGSTWSTATSAGGDDGTTSLTTSAAGTSHTFIWDTVTDLGKDV